jgi:transposase-like protein
MPREMNVDRNPAYPAAVEALKADGVIPRRVGLRQCKYPSVAGQALRLGGAREKIKEAQSLAGIVGSGQP